MRIVARTMEILSAALKTYVPHSSTDNDSLTQNMMDDEQRSRHVVYVGVSYTHTLKKLNLGQPSLSNLFSNYRRKTKVSNYRKHKIFNPTTTFWYFAWSRLKSTNYNRKTVCLMEFVQGDAHNNIIIVNEIKMFLSLKFWVHTEINTTNNGDTGLPVHAQTYLGQNCVPKVWNLFCYFVND